MKRNEKNVKIAGKNAPDDLRLSALDLKPNFKLMMVGSLEADIQGVCNVQFDNRDVIDDFDEDNNDERSSYNFHKNEVCYIIPNYYFACYAECLRITCYYFCRKRRETEHSKI